MREGWEYKKLGQVCTSDLGKTLNKSRIEENFILTSARLIYYGIK